MNPEIAVVRQILSQTPLSESASMDVVQQRAAMEAFTAQLPVRSGAKADVIALGGVPAERVIASGASSLRVILYLHGGGYSMGSPRTHRSLAAELSAASGATVWVIDYPLAPEHPFPEGLDAAVAAYKALLAQRLKPEHLVIAGDSAGGGLTLALAVKLKELGLPQPAGLFCISPWADLTQSGDSHRTHASRDPMVTTNDLNQSAEHYAGKTTATNPMISPVKGDFAGLSPILVHVGTEEVLFSDSLMVAARAGEAGIECTLIVAPEMIHVWHAFFPMLSAARSAIADAGAWIKTRTGA